MSFIFTCPKCSKTRKFYVRKSDGRSICFRCENFRGDGAWALYQLFGVPFSEGRQILYGELPFERGSALDFEIVDHYGEDDEEEFVRDLPSPRQWPLTAVTVEHAPPKAVEYLASRGVSIDLADRYDIRWDGTQQRILFPVVVEGELLGWQGRFIHPTTVYTDRRKIEIPKVVSTEGLAGGRVLMFQDRLASADVAVLAEGPFDAIKADLVGGNVASMGKGVSAVQLQTIADAKVKRLYVALDRDATEDTMRVVREMAPKMETYLLEPPPHRSDLGDCTVEEVVQAVEEAEPIRPSRLLLHLEMPKWMAR